MSYLSLQIAELLLLFGGQGLLDVLHGRHVRQVQIGLFGGNSLKRGFHLVDIDGWRIDIDLEPNAFPGMGAQQVLHFHLLIIRQIELLGQAVHHPLHVPHHAPAHYTPAHHAALAHLTVHLLHHALH